METLPFNVLFKRNKGNQLQFEIRFGFGSLNIAQVAITYTEGELVYPKLQMSKRQRFIKF